MGRNFEVEMAIYAWDEVFQVTSLLKEDNLWKNTFDIKEAMKIVPFAVTKALELKDEVCPDDVAEVLWPISVWLETFTNSVLKLVDLTNEEISKKYQAYGWCWWVIITWVQEITIH